MQDKNKEELFSFLAKKQRDIQSPPGKTLLVTEKDKVVFIQNTVDDANDVSPHGQEEPDT